jgi:hypothetical protein
VSASDAGSRFVHAYAMGDSQMRYGCIAATVCAIALAACASNPTRSSQAACTLSDADSVYASSGPVYRDCAVDTRAKAVATPVDYTPPAGGRPQPGVVCYTAEVQFVVGVDGQPEPGSARLVRSNESSLGQSLLQSVPGWRYSPALLDGTPVRQIVRESRGVAVAVTVTRGSQGSASRPRVPPSCR